MIKLCDVPASKKVQICSIDGDTRFLTRITSIGLTVSGNLSVVSNEKRLPLLVYSRDSLIAVNREESARILVREEQ